MSTTTRLAHFMRVHGIPHGRLATLAGISRQHLYRLKTGRMEPTRPVMIRLAAAAAVMRKRRVKVSDLFDLRINT